LSDAAPGFCAGVRLGSDSGADPRVHRSGGTPPERNAMRMASAASTKPSRAPEVPASDEPDPALRPGASDSRPVPQGLSRARESPVGSSTIRRRMSCCSGSSRTTSTSPRRSTRSGPTTTINSPASASNSWRVAPSSSRSETRATTFSSYLGTRPAWTSGTGNPEPLPPATLFDIVPNDAAQSEARRAHGSWTT
jgi:hypothetical protein